jgi:tRNA A-37 threonylcarbamoyl transferase component Bud32
MLVANPCPDAAALRRYLLGQTPLPEADAVEQHLAACPRCLQSLEGLRADDSLTLNLRAGAREQPDSPEVAELIQRLSRLGELPSEQATQALDGSTPSEEPTASRPAGGVTEHTTKGFGFLGPAQQPDEMGRLGGYRILRVLGTGGMGVVFEAEEAALGRRVALKVMRSEMAMNPAARKRFLREARAMAAATSITNHDHIVTIHAVGEADGIPFISMPLLRGETLDDRLKREPRLAAAEVVRIGREIALGLAAAHEQGLVHRDIKPSNIWLEANTGRVKVMDFGLARVPGDTDQNLTQEGAIVGTPNFMAPEQARGEPLDHRCDLFSLGSVLYRAATGELPFKGNDSLSTLLAVASQTPRSPRELNPDLPPALSNLIMWLLTREPAGRPASALAVADALSNLDNPAVSIPPATPAESSATMVLPRPQTGSPPARGKRFPRGRLVAAVALLMFVAFCAVNLLNLPKLWHAITYTGGLVIETDEPIVELVVQDENGVIQLHGDQRQVDLAPGKYKIDVSLADRDNRPFGFTADVTIVWGRTTVVDGHEGGKLLTDARRLIWERDSAEEIQTLRRPPVVLGDRENPFVIVRNDGASDTAFTEFPTLKDALDHTKDGDRIEVYGNGPFKVGSINLHNRGLDLRAGAGYRPVLLLSDEIKVSDHSVHIDGCDLQAAFGHRLLYSRGADCALQNCRIWQPTLDSQVIEYEGPKFTLTDCMVQAPEASVLSWRGERSAGGEAEFRNNLILKNSATLVSVPGPGGQRLRLFNNTVLAGTKDGVIKLGPWVFDKVVVQAEGNQFGTTLFKDVVTDRRESILKWLGRENMYSNRVAFAVLFDGGKPSALDLHGWYKRWNITPDEPGSEELDDVRFKWFAPRGKDTADILKFMKRRIDQLRAAHPDIPKDCGPNWELIGPGDAYVRSLATKDGPLPKEQIRPPSFGDRVIALYRPNDKAQWVDTFLDLQAAIDNATDQAVIEVRTDDLLADCLVMKPMGKKRRITIRATPGYLPRFNGPVGLRIEEGNVVTVEGFHFQRGGLVCVMDENGQGGHIARVANCSFEGEPPADGHSAHIYGGFDKDIREPMEVVNSVTTGPVFFTLTRGREVNVRNSVVGGVHAEQRVEGGAGVSIRQSLVDAESYIGPAVQLSQKAKCKWGVFVDGCLLATPTLLDGIVPKQDVTWKGSANVYCAAHHNWLRVDGPQEFIGDLDAWRKKWASDEKASIVAEALLDDPRMWSLAPGSPGYRGRRGGKDYGADVNRVGVTAPAEPAKK